MTPPATSCTASERDLLAANQRFYDALWADARLIDADQFNTWPLMRALARRRTASPRAGLRPILPLPHAVVDISASALSQLRAHGARVAGGSITALPFADECFDLVAALDIIEHVDDDDTALAELARVVAGGGVLVIATPLHPSRFTVFDEFVGHRRRYEPEHLLAKLTDRGLTVEQSAVFGMQPRSTGPLNLGMWFLTRQRERAMWWYNRVMPYAVRTRRRSLAAGMIDTAAVDEVLCLPQGANGRKLADDVARSTWRRRSGALHDRLRDSRSALHRPPGSAR
jgi:SAM-dependent methyltransferase